MTEALMRHWQMLRLVPRAPRKVSTDALERALRQHGFDAHRRSIQRDLLKLSASFPLVCDDESKPYGWSWARDAEPFDVPGLDLHAALAFHMASDALERVLPAATRKALGPHVERARRTLDALGASHPLAAWRDKVRVIAPGLPRRGPDIAPGVLEAVQTALFEERRLQVRYRRRDETAEKAWDVHPLALVSRDAFAYLVCRIHTHDDVRQLALHRIASATCDEVPSRTSPSIDVDAYVRSGAFGFVVTEEPVALEVLLDPVAATTHIEAPIAEDQRTTAEADGRVRLTATVPNTTELRVWLRGLGPLVEVVQPASIRQELASEALAIARRYGLAE